MELETIPEDEELELTDEEIDITPDFVTVDWGDNVRIPESVIVDNGVVVTDLKADVLRLLVEVVLIELDIVLLMTPVCVPEDDPLTDDEAE